MTHELLMLRRAVEHLLVGLPLIRPSQLSFLLLAKGCSLHSMLSYNPIKNELGYGWGSDCPPVEMAAHEQVAGGVYADWDDEPPELNDNELERWDKVFNQIHGLIHNGKIVRFGAYDDDLFIATVEHKPGTGLATIAATLLEALEVALELSSE